MKKSLLFIGIILLLGAVSFACVTTPAPEEPKPLPTYTPYPTYTPFPVPTEVPEPLPTAVPEDHEPEFITGTIPFTSPFFVNALAEPFVLLEDQAGFYARDEYYEFSLASQTIGPVEQIDDNTLSFSLTLPLVPQGTLLDVDNNGAEDQGVMVFAVGFWSNIWGGPFLEPRDGTGWSTAHATTTTDPEFDYEINGGHLIIWAPDDLQSFPSGFGEDLKLFTEDDPVQPVEKGYNIVDLNSEPFEIYKEKYPEFVLEEGETGVNDYSEMTYEEAFEALFAKIRVEYAFSVEKGIDWDLLYEEFLPRIAQAKNDDQFYIVMQEFSQRFMDGHVSLSLNFDVFFEQAGGSMGLILSELTDGRIMIVEVWPGFPADLDGIEAGVEIVEWNGQPASEALANVYSPFGPYSTVHHLRRDQLIFMERSPLGTIVELKYKQPNGSMRTTELQSEFDYYETLLAAMPIFQADDLEPPIVTESMLGNAYIKINTFSDDYNLMARIWERTIETMIELEVPGVVIDLRMNGGGSGGLATAFAEYFVAEPLKIGRFAYYSDVSETFEYSEFDMELEPGPMLYEGKIAVLVSPNCVSACELFAHYLDLLPGTRIYGFWPTAGAFGEVGRGQFSLPGGYDMQFPTGRSETFSGELLLEGTGVVPDVTAKITLDNIFANYDVLLEMALTWLQE